MLTKITNAQCATGRKLDCGKHFLFLPPTPPPFLGDVNEMESPAEIISDQADQTKHTSREEEKMGQNELPGGFSYLCASNSKSEYRVFIVSIRKCD